jgi:predicted PhzF superfamily epimerase YddE/YHI9
LTNLNKPFHDFDRVVDSAEIGHAHRNFHRSSPNFNLRDAVTGSSSGSLVSYANDHRRVNTEAARALVVYMSGQAPQNPETTQHLQIAQLLIMLESMIMVRW